MEEEMRKGIRILKTRIGLVSNNPYLIDDSQFYLMDTDFREVKEIDFSTEMDSFIYINDEKGILPKVQITDERISVNGDLSGLNENIKDRRYGLFGNLGLLPRLALYLLETRYDIFSYHAAAIYDERKALFFIIIGGPGSGKTCFLLNAIEKGLKIFSTELVHFKIAGRGSPIFYKGPLADNIRVGNLKYDYPKAREMLKVDLPEIRDEWGTQVWDVDMSGFQTSFDELEDPAIIIVFPHVEHKWDKTIKGQIEDKRVLKKSLFDNISEKIGKSFVLYESLPMSGLDSEESVDRRMENVEGFVDKANIKKVVRITTGAGDYIMDLIE